MLFNSFQFIFVFVPLVFFIYYLLIGSRKLAGARFFLVLASLIFYGYWKPIYLLLIILSILINFKLGKMLGISHDKKVLTLGVSFNIFLLAFFKYTDFFIKNINFLFSTEIHLLKIVLPLAISFFTFQQIAYLVDSYKGQTKEYDFFSYVLFVSFFPQLIAGPIVHHKEMMPQFTQPENLKINLNNIATGLYVFAIGLFKKVIIADTFAVWANDGYSMAGELNLLEAWTTSLSYTFQLYFDFSGYTDMAIGVALLFNIKLPINFNSPYKAVSIQDFWRRWHMTLSTFLRDYLYIPFGGNRKGELYTYRNLFLTFLLGGFWHGASWMFIIWGALHGLSTIVHRLWSKTGIKLNKFIAWFVTFQFINITWIFFRAESVTDAIHIIRGMLGLNSVIFPAKYQSLFSSLGLKTGKVFAHLEGGSRAFIFIAFFTCFCAIAKNSIERYKEFKPRVLTLTISVVFFYYSVINLNKITKFLYFNF